MARYWLYGRHAVISALRNEVRVKHHLKLTSATVDFLYKHNIDIKKIQTKVSIVDNAYLDKELDKGVNHQGIALLVSTIKEMYLEDCLQTVSQKDTILMLDQVNDPHNIGAIMRSALAFGVTKIIYTDKNSFAENAVIAKTSAGAIEHIELIKVANLVHAIKLLKSHNYWILGMDGYAKSDIKELDDFQKTCLVVGSEGKGIRRLIKQHCDLLVKINMDSRMESINVSNAVAIALHQIL